MKKAEIEFNLDDNGGRRSGIDRRRFLYAGHIPERRLTSDRRKGIDRRSGYDRRDFLSQETDSKERRSYIDRRSAFKQI